ncbi:MAG: hypothetical protein M1133_08810 [Armatimonadetes bacterium]|nr:hypothetical protein [Armatimonadota bacterium]
MSVFEQLSTGKKLEALSQRVAELQKEVASLRNDVRTILHLLRQIEVIKAEPGQLADDET